MSATLGWIKYGNRLMAIRRSTSSSRHVDTVTQWTHANTLQTSLVEQVIDNQTEHLTAASLDDTLHCMHPETTQITADVSSKAKCADDQTLKCVL